MHNRHTEHRHHRITDELLDRPAVPLDNPPHPREITRQQRSQRLRIRRLPQRRRPGHITEDHRHRLPLFPLDGRTRQRSGALLAELRAGPIFVTATRADQHKPRLEHPRPKPRESRLPLARFWQPAQPCPAPTRPKANRRFSSTMRISEPEMGSTGHPRHLSRRRSRVRVPSLPLKKALVTGLSLLQERLAIPAKSLNGSGSGPIGTRPRVTNESWLDGGGPGTLVSFHHVEGSHRHFRHLGDVLLRCDHVIARPRNGRKTRYP